VRYVYVFLLLSPAALAQSPHRTVVPPIEIRTPPPAPALVVVVPRQVPRIPVPIELSESMVARIVASVDEPALR